MSEFYLEKYPVISSNGNEYSVTVSQDRYVNKRVTAQVFIIRKGLFGRIRFVSVWGGDMFDRKLYNEDEWSYDYIAIALHAVRKYEDMLEDKRQHESDRSQGAKRFEDWDGRHPNE
jgi:hypothetical protein